MIRTTGVAGCCSLTVWRRSSPLSPGILMSDTTRSKESFAIRSSASSALVGGRHVTSVRGEDQGRNRRTDAWSSTSKVRRRSGVDGDAAAAWRAELTGSVMGFRSFPGPVGPVAAVSRLDPCLTRCAPSARPNAGIEMQHRFHMGVACRKRRAAQRLRRSRAGSERRDDGQFLTVASADENRATWDFPGRGRHDPGAGAGGGYPSRGPCRRRAARAMPMTFGGFGCRGLRPSTACPSDQPFTSSSSREAASSALGVRAGVSAAGPGTGVVEPGDLGQPCRRGCRPNASVTTGSNWVPAFLRIWSSAASMGMAAR